MLFLGFVMFVLTLQKDYYGVQFTMVRRGSCYTGTAYIDNCTIIN